MKRIGLWLALPVALGWLTACSQRETQEPTQAPQPALEGTTTVDVSLTAEVDSEDLRALGYELGADSKGKLVPRLRLSDGDLVDVHTVIKSSDGIQILKTLKWTYVAATKSLRLDQKVDFDTHESSFNHDGGRRWYISAILGGTLDETSGRVVPTPNHVLTGVSRTAGTPVSLEVPYALPWTELSVVTNTDNLDGKLHGRPKLQSSSPLTFKIRGALVAYTIGNAQTAGSYDFTPTGFTVYSRRMGHEGYFDLAGTPTAGQLPTWTPERATCAHIMEYTFAAPVGTIAHGAQAPLVYYAWVMQGEYAYHYKHPTWILLHGTSSSPGAVGRVDFLSSFKDEKNRAVVADGSVYSATIAATRPLFLPIEYVAEYNLAGGNGGLASTIDWCGATPAGVQGPLRFSRHTASLGINPDPYRNDQSGYYNWRITYDQEHVDLNPGRSLSLVTQTLVDQDGSSITLGDKYHVPTWEHDWSAIFPVKHLEVSTAAQGAGYARLGMGATRDLTLMLNFWHRWTPAYTTASGKVVYALFFGAIPASNYTHCTYPDRATEPTSGAEMLFSPAPDNRLLCAYRFRFIGDWTKFDSSVFTSRLIIDVVHLGEAGAGRELSSLISEPESFWAGGISRTFSANGRVQAGNSSRLQDRGWLESYWLRNYQYYHPFRARLFNLVELAFAPRYGYEDDETNISAGRSVRLFYRDDVR